MPRGGGEIPPGLTAEEAAQHERMQMMAAEYDQWCAFLAHVRPVAVTTRVRVNDALVGGKPVPHVELTVVLPTGPCVIFLPAQIASELAAQLDRAATGARTGLDPFAGNMPRLEMPR